MLTVNIKYKSHKNNNMFMLRTATFQITHLIFFISLLFSDADVSTNSFVSKELTVSLPIAVYTNPFCRSWLIVDLN
jgi:hypothetical protein